MSESCNIKNLGTIKINGLSNKVKIVGADYQVGSLEEPSSVSVTFIDKEGYADSIPRTLQTPTEIEFGGMTFTGYAISEERTCDPSGNNTITVNYTDGSFILDKILVGLWGKHSEVSERTLEVGSITLKDWSKPSSYHGSDPLIIVGNPIDPCGDKELDVKVDTCDPCPEAPLEIVRTYEETMKKIDCEKIRELQIFDVEYSFQDLVTAINDGWPPVRIEENDTIQNADTYKNNYSGTLRSVLNSWCSDYGWSYYWEDDKIKIVDLKAGIDVNLKGLDTNCDVTSISTKRSLEGTYSNSVIGYYGREGQERDYQCNYEFGKRVVCRPLTLKDLLSNEAPLAKLASGYTGVSGASPLEMALDNYDLAELLCLCSSYHPKIREAVAWLNVYGVVSASAAQERVTTSKSVSGISGVSISYDAYHDMGYYDDLNLGKSSLPLLDMTIKKVFSSSDSEFDDIKDALKGDIERFVDDENTEDGDYFIFIGHVNEEKFNLRYEWESSVGSDFLGSYFIRKYSNTHGSNPQLTAAGGDGATYYEQGEKSLDFSEFFITPNPESYVGELTDGGGEANDSFIMVERSPVSTPPKAEGDLIEALVEICEDIVPKFATSVHSLPDTIDLTSAGFKNDHPDAPSEFGGWAPEDSIYLVKKYKDSNNGGALTISNLTTYDFHPKEETKTIEVDNFSTPIKVGLRSTQAKKVFIENNVFWFPPQSTVRESSTGSETAHIPYAGGYYVYLRNNPSVENLIRVPKVEVIEQELKSYKNNTLSNNLITVSLDDNTIDEYYYDEEDLGCKVDKSLVRTFIGDYISPLVFEQDQELEETRIEMNGIPENNFKIEDGFRGMSVRFYGDGPSTSITFRNSFEIPINPDIRKEIQAKNPTFFTNSSRRKWGNAPADYPSEGGFPTI